MKNPQRLLVCVLLLVAGGVAVGRSDERRAPGKTGNVILVLVDGLRWREVFTGAEDALMTKENGVENPDALTKVYKRDTAEARRAALLPFFWQVVAKQGQLLGNQDKGSVVRVSNEKRISYPGYSEMVVGFADPRIDSNDKRPNPNMTVLEWLAGRPGFQDRVAAFAAWDVVPFIFNRERCGFYINAGLEPVTESASTPPLDLLNRLKTEIPPRWGGEPFDALTFHSALEYLKQHKPRVFYLAFGETDEWAHEGRYGEYLDAARRSDFFVRNLWDTVQALHEYQGKTTLIIVADHGRGDGPQEWRNHGAKTNGAENIWIAVIGPDTPALGERTNTEPLTLAQVAATLAAALREDYCAAVPNAAPPIADVFVRAPK
jgi:hypothetical protein